MSLIDFRDMTDQELLESLEEARKEKFNLRFQVATNQLDNTARLSAAKKEVARILTVMRERELAEERAPGAEENE